MKYILIITLLNSAASVKGLGVGSSVATAEFNSYEACQSAGEIWLKKNKSIKAMSGYTNQTKADYICAPKGE